MGSHTLLLASPVLFRDWCGTVQFGIQPLFCRGGAAIPNGTVYRTARYRTLHGNTEGAGRLQTSCSTSLGSSILLRQSGSIGYQDVVPETVKPGVLFVKNHAKEIFACDFLTQHTITFRVFYIFAVMEVGSRRNVHFNITEHPILEWVKQQLREATIDLVPRFLIHDNDGIFGQFAYKNRPHLVSNPKTVRIVSLDSASCSLEHDPFCPAGSDQFLRNTAQALTYCSRISATHSSSQYLRRFPNTLETKPIWPP